MIERAPITDRPSQNEYDIVIVGGAMIGSSVAWYVAHHLGFDGRVLVVERDMSLEYSSTGHSNSCMRQQFSNPLNVQMSQYTAEHIGRFREDLGGDADIPAIFVHDFGYMYLADNEQFATRLKAQQVIQSDLGVATRIMSPDEIAAEYPFYNLEDIICGSHNTVDEGYFDSGTMLEWWRNKAREHGVEYTRGEVVGVEVVDDRVTAASLSSGDKIQTSALVNAAGPRANRLAEMAGLSIPVEPRKRFTFIFKSADPLDRALPLTIDPSGVHVRTDGDAYMAGCHPDIDVAVDPHDFEMDNEIWEEKVWPALATRIPAFERLKVTSQWAGHYAYNVLDQNVIVGAHPERTNFFLANGFSGHGLQQAPSIGRGIAELLVHGEYRSLDLAPLGYQRVIDNVPFGETALI